MDVKTGEAVRGRYSPAKCIGAKRIAVTGNPDMDHASTSCAERQDLTMRMHMRRFTRLTNAFSKKAENHCHMVALYTSGTTMSATTLAGSFPGQNSATDLAGW
jgi:hypothetical protein